MEAIRLLEETNQTIRTTTPSEAINNRGNLEVPEVNTVPLGVTLRTDFTSWASVRNI